MEACPTASEMLQTPAIAIVTPASLSGSALVRAAATGLVFSLAFSSSFVLGFYGLGPWIDAAKSMM